MYYLTYSWLYQNSEMAENCAKFLIWISVTTWTLAAFVKHKTERQVPEYVSNIVSMIPITILAGHGQFLYASLWFAASVMCGITKIKDEQP